MPTQLRSLYYADVRCKKIAVQVSIAEYVYVHIHDGASTLIESIIFVRFMYDFDFQSILMHLNYQSSYMLILLGFLKDVFLVKKTFK